MKVTCARKRKPHLKDLLEVASKWMRKLAILRPHVDEVDGVYEKRRLDGANVVDRLLAGG